MKNRGKLILWITFIILIVVVIVLVVTTFSSKDKEASRFQSAANTVMKPAVEGTYNSSMSVKNFFQRLFALRQIDKDYAELKSKIIALELDNQFMKDLQIENDRLIDLLGYMERNPEYKYISARVIAKDPGNWFMEFTINRGTDDGVEVDMAVANQYGLIGRVIQTTATTATVITIIDTRSAAASVVERSRDQGMVKGAIDPDSKTPLCHLDHLPNNADLIPGDIVLSSSLGGIFPKGVLIGEIQEVVLESGAVAYAIVKPSVDFGHIEEILVIAQEVTAEELERIKKEEAEAEAEAAQQEEEAAQQEETSTSEDAG